MNCNYTVVGKLICKETFVNDVIGKKRAPKKKKEEASTMKRANGEVCGLNFDTAGCTGDNCATWEGVSYSGDHSQCESNNCKCKDDLCLCSEKPRKNGEVCGLNFDTAGCTGDNCATWDGVSYSGDHSQCESNHCKCKDDLCLCSEKEDKSVSGSVCAKWVNTCVEWK